MPLLNSMALATPIPPTRHTTTASAQRAHELSLPACYLPQPQLCLRVLVHLGDPRRLEVFSSIRVGLQVYSSVIVRVQQ